MQSGRHQDNSSSGSTEAAIPSNRQDQLKTGILYMGLSDTLKIHSKVARSLTSVGRTTILHAYEVYQYEVYDL